MSAPSRNDSGEAARGKRIAAFCVHVFTAMGAGIALVALIAAVREQWAAMFAWLGLALIIDALDGPIARRLNVGRVLPDWSGEALDFVVDFITYVFVPAYAITASGLLSPWTATLLGVGIVVSSALYFSDRRMKADDNHFRGFPALWNAVAFYLFLLRPVEPLASFAMAALIVLTFVPIRVLHPIRVARLREFNLAIMALWTALSIITLVQGFDVAMPVTVTLCLIAFYILCGDMVIRLLKAARP